MALELERADSTLDDVARAPYHIPDPQPEPGVARGVACVAVCVLSEC